MAQKTVLTPEKAIAILQGAGVKVDTKKKVQVWTIGMTVTPKVAAAGKILDAIMIQDEKGMKPEWRTKWIHSATCTCPDCVEHVLNPIRKTLPKQKVAKAA